MDIGKHVTPPPTYRNIADCLRATIEQQEKLIAELGERLSPMLRPQETSTVGAVLAEAPLNQIAPQTAELCVATSKIQRQNEKLIALLAHIDL